MDVSDVRDVANVVCVVPARGGAVKPADYQRVVEEIIHRHRCECLGTAHPEDSKAAKAVVKAMLQMTGQAPGFRPSLAQRWRR